MLKPGLNGRALVDVSVRTHDRIFEDVVGYRANKSVRDRGTASRLVGGAGGGGHGLGVLLQKSLRVGAALLIAVLLRPRDRRPSPKMFLRTDFRVGAPALMIAMLGLRDGDGRPSLNLNPYKNQPRKCRCSCCRDIYNTMLRARTATKNCSLRAIILLYNDVSGQKIKNHF